jgi:myo-inositol-1(or 4)-monophosphatase
MTNTIHPMLNIAVSAARAAGAIINRAALDIESVRISSKLANDFVTEVDQNAEKAIIETLLTAYPKHGIWAEESGQTGNPDADHVWIIDPLDGTTNFIHGYPVYCVSIGLAVKDKNGKLKMDQAVIYDPTRNDLFTASKGRGAYQNDRRIRVGKRIALRDCLLTTGLPFRANESPKKTFEILNDVMNHCVAIRRAGAAALDMAYVAAGYADGYFETGLFPWDVAAGSLLITEAGGLVGNYSGEADFLEAKEVVCGNPKIYGQLVGVLGKYSAFGAK